MAEAPQGIIGRATELVHKVVRQSLPNERYESSVGVYGGKFVETPDHKMVLDLRFVKPNIAEGLGSALDVTGDKVVRPYDDHIMKDTWAMLKRHPAQWMKFVFKRTVPRYRGSRDQILENIKRLGLSDYYGAHQWGIEIKQPDIFNKGFALQDILRAKEIGAEVLQDIDPLQAIRETTAYIKEIHEGFGAVGDLVGDIMLRKKVVTKEGVKVVDPVLNIPDIVLPKENVRQAMIAEVKKRKAIKQNIESGGSGILSQDEEGEIKKEALKAIAKEQKATDVLEHMVSVGFEIARQKDSPVDVGTAMRVIVGAYGDGDVLKIVRSFLGRGRPTLPREGIINELLSQHNTKHLGADRENAELVRNAAIEELSTYLRIDKILKKT